MMAGCLDEWLDLFINWNGWKLGMEVDYSVFSLTFSYISLMSILWHNSIKKAGVILV